MKRTSLALLLTLIILITGCGGGGGSDDDTADVSDVTAQIEIVNHGASRITYLNIGPFPIINNASSYPNEIEGAPIAINETRTLDLSCLGSDTAYIRVGWETGVIEDYSIHAICGYVYTVTLPQ